MDELWRQCVHWLIETGVLPRQHKTSFPHSQVFDLAQTLRDGVVLCNLLNTLRPGAVDLSKINIRPQMLNFLCMQNIHTVIHSLKTVFRIEEYELFEAQDLYEMTNFRQVLRVLSRVSHLPISTHKFRPFPINNNSQENFQRRDEEDDEDIYSPLAELASERELMDEDEDLYDSVADLEEDGIYGSVIDFKPSKTVPKDKRSFCVNEIVETERNYVNHLAMMCNKFITPMRKYFDENDIKTLFSNIEQLLPVHQELLRDIENAYEDGMSKMSKPFLKVKNHLLSYGVYCSNLPAATTRLATLIQDEDVRQTIDSLQNVATPNKFKLRELLFVSMQRILKYHLLVKELSKQTKDSHIDKNDVEKALEAMQEVAQHINEVKRDSEMMQTITKVQSCLVDYHMSTPLSAYGRLLKDGDLKFKTFKDRKAQLRFAYLFNQALFVTNAKTDFYKLTDLIRLEDFILDEPSQLKGGKWSWSWTLRDKFGSQSYVVFAKTQNDKMKWLEFIKIAFDSIRPGELKGKDHSFKMATFDEPTYCCHCRKLMLGAFFQGYACERTKKNCHKACLLETWKNLEEDAPPVERRPPPPVTPLTPSPGTGKTSMTFGGMYKAHRDYNGIPAPPFAKGNFITFGVGEQIEVLEQVTTQWWMGRSFGQYDRVGYLPASHVSPSVDRESKTSMSYEIAVIERKPQLPPPLPTSPKMKSSNRLEDYDWFAGQMDRTGADNLLRGKPSGTYLVRVREGNYAISLLFNSETKHIRIFQSSSEYWVADSVTFPSIPELVRYYQTTKLSSSFYGLETSLLSPYRASRRSSTNPALRALPPPVNRTPRPPPQQSSTFPAASRINVDGKLFEVISQGKVLYDFDPQSDQELGLRTGQIVKIIGKPNGIDGWWKGEYQNRVGYFPAKFVQEIRI